PKIIVVFLFFRRSKFKKQRNYKMILAEFTLFQAMWKRLQRSHCPLAHEILIIFRFQSVGMKRESVTHPYSITVFKQSCLPLPSQFKKPTSPSFIRTVVKRLSFDNS